MAKLTLLTVALGLAAPALAQVETDLGREVAGPSAWTLRDSDRVFIIASQAQTMAPLSFRAGTLDQMQAVRGVGTGYQTEVFADFSPLSWLQLGVTMDYSTLGDPATQNLLAPAAYAQAQFLHQERSGVDMAASVNLKRYGFSSPTADHPNDGEVEAQLLVNRSFGRLLLTANGVFGKSFNVPDSDAELKLAAGYRLRRNLLVGLDSLTRYDTSFDGGPMDGTRYWEFTGGPMATWKVWDFTLSALAGIAAPMHAPVGAPGVGPTGMIQIAYSL
ncbi:MAG: hypothetical protein ACYDCL_23890 [Myxococcales bacterium]